MISIPTISDKYLKKFRIELEEILDEQFPKLNEDNPEIASPNRRSAALVLYAYATILFNRLLVEFGDEISRNYDSKAVDNSPIDRFGRFAKLKKK